MRPWQYKLFKWTSGISTAFHGSISPTGRFMIGMAVVAGIFGLNTEATMLYQLAALSVMLLVIAFPLSRVFQTELHVARVLPVSCTAGEELIYLLRIENRGKKRARGLYFREISGAGYPTFDEFDSTPEAGEEKRNYFDRKMGYYRWLWLLRDKHGADFSSQALADILPGEAIDAEVSFLPARRGYVRLGGYVLFRMDPLGLFKKELFFRDENKILALPRIYPVHQREMGGARKYHQGGMTSAGVTGDSGEFVSLRDYRAGDPVKHIDWKGTARAGDVVVRQYQNEYFTRYGVVLDTFLSGSDTQIFEEAVAVAASIIVQQDMQKTIIDLLFAGNNCISAISTGQGPAVRDHMLEALACADVCRGRFAELTRTVMEHAALLSGLILVFLDLDDDRIELVDYLESVGLTYQLVLVCDDAAKGRSLLAEKANGRGIIHDLNREPKMVNLA